MPKWVRKTRNDTGSKSDKRNDRSNEKIEERNQGGVSGQTAYSSKDRYYIRLNSLASLEVLRFCRKRRLQKTF